jgi:catechol 2,3-dioxygenase-like lactoylglutathione lyase family enzyme
MSNETTRRIFLGAVGAIATTNSAAADIEKVTGIGGLFFRAKDPKVLAKWYSDHLGVGLVPSGSGDQPWRQDAGPCAFQPFPEKTTYFGNVAKQWMVNFRVRNMDAMVAQLRAAGIAVEVDGKLYPNGQFAHLSDPEGNPIELWEEKARDAH